jgi:predicted HD phosphohydrolase
MTTTTDRKWFGSIKESTQEDWDALKEDDEKLRAGLPNRVLEHLVALDEQESIFPLSRLGHSLQTATRASRAGKDDEYVLCALLHDIGDTLATYNHAEMGATVVRPFVRPEYHWMVEQHAVFQGYYFFHYVGRDRNEREKFRGNPNFELTEEFCEEFDQPAFETSYPSMSLGEFAPLVHALMAQPRRSLAS